MCKLYTTLYAPGARSVGRNLVSGCAGRGRRCQSMGQIRRLQRLPMKQHISGRTMPSEGTTVGYAANLGRAWRVAGDMSPSAALPPCLSSEGAGTPLIKRLTPRFQAGLSACSLRALLTRACLRSISCVLHASHAVSPRRDGWLRLAMWQAGGITPKEKISAASVTLVGRSIRRSVVLS